MRFVRLPRKHPKILILLQVKKYQSYCDSVRTNSIRVAIMINWCNPKKYFIFYKKCCRVILRSLSIY